MIVSESKWLAWPELRPHARLRLLCLHHAGGAVSAYAHWARLIRPDTEFLVVQLPGRENRRSEPPLVESREVMERLLPHLQRELRPPYALFGHSMGGLLAFRLAQRILQSGELPPPQRLIVSAAPAPDDRGGRRELASLSNEDLVKHLRQHGGTPEVILSNPQMLAAFLPTLRADLALSASLAKYQAFDGPVAGLQLSVFRGADDPASQRQDAKAWAGSCQPPTSEHVFAGGHFYYRERLGTVIGVLNSILAADLS